MQAISTFFPRQFTEALVRAGRHCFVLVCVFAALLATVTRSVAGLGAARGRFAGLAARASATFVLALFCLVLGATPAVANPATVNGITAETTLPQATRGVAYSYTIVPTGGTGGGPYTFALINGTTLPLGLTLSSGGVISGTVDCGQANGNTSFSIRIVSSGGTTADFVPNDHFRMNVTANPANVCTLTLSAITTTGSTAANYSSTITSSGSTAPYTYTLVGGSLPPGLSLSSGGTISGLPTTAGTYSFTVQSVSSSSTPQSGNKTYTITITQATLTLSPATLPIGTTGTSYSQTITATGGIGANTFAVTAGTLPTGLTLSSGGVLSGTPTVAGTYNFTITGTDSNGNTGSRAYSITVYAPITVSPTSLPNGTTGTSYSQMITASGGSGTYTNFAVSAGSLPTGLSLSPTTGAITGTPSVAGTYNFTIQVTDNASNTGSRAYTVIIYAPITVSPTSLPNGTNGTSYGTQTITATGGTGTYTNFAVTVGSLPTGLSLNASNGDITGTPTAAGTFNFTVQVTDDAGNTGTRAYSVTIAAGAVLTVNPATLPNGTNGTSYGTQTITATGGTGTYTNFAVTVGSLPTGLSLNASNGDITGTPTAAGTFNFTVQVTDDAGNTGTRAYSVTIAPGAVLTVNPATLPNGTNGTSYGTQTITATGGTGTYTNFAVTAGALPTGLSLNPTTGAITGTPSAAGTFNFDVTVTDSAGNTGVRSYSVTMSLPALTLNPATLPDGTNGTAYSQSVTGSGGSGSYTDYSVTSGALPTSLSLNPTTGAITGTPTAAGTFNFRITVTDSAANTAFRDYTVTIAPGAVLTVNPATLPDGTTGTAYSQTITATGGTGSYTFAVSSGALPTGLSLNTSTGEISGTPTASGAFTFTLYVEDSFGNWGSRDFTLNVVVARPNPALDPEVTGLIGSQFDIAGQFAEGQLATVARHLEGLRGDDCGTAPDGDADANGEQSQSASQCEHGFSFWGAVTAEEGRDGAYEAGSVTGGVDWRVSNDLALGLAASAAYGSEDVGTNGSGVDALGESVTGYFLYNPLGGLYLEGALGWGSMDMGVDRYVTQSGGFASGDRAAEVVFGSLGLDYELQLGAVRLSPYARYEFVDITLDAASESGASADNLTYLRADRRIQSVVTGARVSMNFDSDWGQISPYLRLEHRARSLGGYEQLIAYSDDLATLYALTEGGTSNGVWSAALGARADLEIGQINFELGSSGTDGGIFRDFVFRVEFRAPH